MKLSAGYSFTNYLSNSEGLFNSRQASSQARYTYRISRENNIGVVYGYRDFQFVPAVQSVVTNSAQFAFERRFSEHVYLVLGGGPERIVASGVSSKSQINAAPQGSFGYRRKKSHLDVSYTEWSRQAQGSTLAVLAQTDIVTIAWNPRADL